MAGKKVIDRGCLNKIFIIGIILVNTENQKAKEGFLNFDRI